MSDEIPYAQPFPWTQEEPQRSHNTRSLRKRKFVGSGLAVLRKESLGSESQMGNVAKNILMNLFHQHGIELDGEMESDENKFRGIGLSDRPLAEPRNKAGQETPQNTGSENKSLFCALLQAVAESTTGAVSTRQILRQVCLLLEPGSLPGTMDSKDMVLAALHFLSSNYESKSAFVLRLPLIRPLQPYGDLEKRNYEKIGDWILGDIKGTLSRMEEVFLSSPSSWQWQKRESLSVRLDKDEEESFFRKGTIPLCATARKVKGEGVKKRKPFLKPTTTDSPGPEIAEEKGIIEP